MSKEEQILEQLNKELNEFYKSCKEAKMSDEDIRKIVDPLLFPRPKISGKFYIKMFLTGCVLGISIYYAVTSIESLSWHAAAIGRLAMKAILPYWDWQYLKNEKCLIPNMLKTGTNVEPDFPCALCETIEQINIEFEVDPDILNMKYLKLHRPVVLDNALKNWIDNFTDFKIKVGENSKMADSIPCRIQTNIHNGQNPTLFDLLKKLKHFNSFFLHLQNCEFAAMKAFRVFAPKPNFLPPSTSPVQYSWLLLSENYGPRKFKPIDLQEPLTVIGQIRGKNYFKLLPRRNCAKECPEPIIELEEGHALILTSLWDLEYKPKEGSINMAIILELH